MVDAPLSDELYLSLQISHLNSEERNGTNDETCHHYPMLCRCRVRSGLALRPSRLPGRRALLSLLQVIVCLRCALLGELNYCCGGFLTMHASGHQLPTRIYEDAADFGVAAEAASSALISSVTSFELGGSLLRWSRTDRAVQRSALATSSSLPLTLGRLSVWVSILYSFFDEHWLHVHLSQSSHEDLPQEYDDPPPHVRSAMRVAK